MTVHAYNTVEQTPPAPVARLTPADRDEYAAAHCPLCGGLLWQRVRGLWCQPCRGWLVEELHDGLAVFSLWQGTP